MPRPTRTGVASCLILILLAFPVAVLAEKPMPATLDAMWKIIQEQQKQIEELKAKVSEGESSPKAAGKVVATPASAPVLPSPSAASPSASSAPQPATKPVKTESERKTDILASEVEKLKTQIHIPEKREYVNEWGYGPAASEVYRVNRGLSIGGYGNWFYTDYSGHKGDLKNTMDNARAVVYVGYKFNDWIILNNEFEFEHATTGEGAEQKGEVSVEFSQLDFMLKKYANIRTGLTLVPMGFINEIHEAPTYHGNRRPSVEEYIIPTTWRELGAGLFGELAPGLQYRFYGVSGLNARGYTSEGIAEGRQQGSMALAENLAFTGRIDYAMPFMPGLLAGASAFLGDSGQGQMFAGQKVNAFTQLYEGHVQWHYKGLEFRGLGAVGFIGNAAQLSEANGQTIGSQNYGWYTELAYDVMPWLWQDSSQYLAPFVRYESYNTLASVPDGFTNYGGLYDRWIYQAGLTYKPIQNVAVKLDYRNMNSAANPLANELNLGVGFMY